MQAKITKRTVDAAKVGPRDSFVWDTELKGFGLKVTPAGNKIYLVQTRLNGQLRRFTIGRHGSPWTPDRARKEANSILGKVADGVDPKAARDAAKGDISVGTLVDTYFDAVEGRKKPSTLAVERGLAERHIKPLLRSKRVRALDRAAIERFLADVANGKTATTVKTKKRGKAIVKGGRGTANRTVALLASMLSFAQDRGMITDNPAQGVKKYPERHRERFLSADELKALGEALEAAEDEGTNKYAVAAIRLLVLTGCRKSEALSLEWDWVDFERALAFLPDSKTGAKVIPLGAPALKLLADLPRIDDCDFVFPAGRGEGHFVGLQKVWSDIRERAELEGVRLHDLRHSFASVGAAGGDSLYVVGKLLGHTQARTTQRYAHLADDPVKASADRISEHIDAALKKRGADVVPLKKERA